MTRKGKKPYYSKKNSNTSALAILGVLFLVFLISNLLPVILIGGVGVGTYFLLTRKSRRQKRLAHEQLALLKTNLKQSEKEMFQLGQLLDQQKYQKFESGAQQLLKKLNSYSYLIYSIQKYIPIQDFTKVSQTINQQTAAIQTELKKRERPLKPQNQKSDPHTAPQGKPASSEEEWVLQIAPEIIQSYRNIQKDHQLILQKIKEAQNQSELEVLHGINMKRFRDILEGYLKIKQSPKDYYNADARLEQAQKALEQFDLDLDETLRRLNESQLQDFEISLRMMHARQTDKELFTDQPK